MARATLVAVFLLGIVAQKKNFNEGKSQSNVNQILEDLEQIDSELETLKLRKSQLISKLAVEAPEIHRQLNMDIPSDTCPIDHQQGSNTLLQKRSSETKEDAQSDDDEHIKYLGTLPKNDSLGVATAATIVSLRLPINSKIPKKVRRKHHFADFLITAYSKADSSASIVIRRLPDQDIVLAKPLDMGGIVGHISGATSADMKRGVIVLSFKHIKRVECYTFKAWTKLAPSSDQTHSLPHVTTSARVFHQASLSLDSMLMSDMDESQDEDNTDPKGIDCQPYEGEETTVVMAFYDYKSNPGYLIGYKSGRLELRDENLSLRRCIKVSTGEITSISTLKNRVFAFVSESRLRFGKVYPYAKLERKRLQIAGTCAFSNITLRGSSRGQKSGKLDRVVPYSTDTQVTALITNRMDDPTKLIILFQTAKPPETEVTIAEMVLGSHRGGRQLCRATAAGFAGVTGKVIGASTIFGMMSVLTDEGRVSAFNITRSLTDRSLSIDFLQETTLGWKTPNAKSGGRGVLVASRSHKGKSYIVSIETDSDSSGKQGEIGIFETKGRRKPFNNFVLPKVPILLIGVVVILGYNFIFKRKGNSTVGADTRNALLRHHRNNNSIETRRARAALLAAQMRAAMKNGVRTDWKPTNEEDIVPLREGIRRASRRRAASSRVPLQS
uniref:Uncharacterized protein n=1 Tax=Amorphochlora amoebiformis TaxID=1561963 RepID=A0A7S0DSR5_9EUKA|mmetsp:Transcript_8643/g.13564  ORF Transcript_8643/g.13564 Transcript_8643/m.13564 type:complete len:668 (+) Transcript_8643:14-2017(+)